MSSVIMRHYWGAPSGGALVGDAAALALEKAGFNPVISGTFKFDPSLHKEWYGIDISRYKIYTLTSFTFFGLMLTAFSWIPAKKAVEKEKAWLLFTDLGLYKPIKEDFKSIKVFEYIHFPAEAFYEEKYRYLGFYYKDTEFISSRYSKFPLNLYYETYLHFFKKYNRKNPFEEADIVVTNSKWTAKIAKEVYGEEPPALYSPLSPKIKIIETPKSFDERKDMVFMLGRFSSDKRYDWVIEKIAPRLRANGVKLVIAGSAVLKGQLDYMNYCYRRASSSGLDPIIVSEENKISGALSGNNYVVFLPNASRDAINYFMDNSKAFFHATIHEHLGAAIAEAMARGLPAVVYKSGGAWMDLAKEGYYGLGYETEEEAVDGLMKLIKDKRTAELYYQRSVERVKELGIENFEKGLIATLKKISP